MAKLDLNATQTSPIRKNNEDQPTIYSHSRLSSYERCPRKYKLRYIDRVISEVETVEAFMGKRVHEALEELYEQVREGVTLSEKELLAVHERGWKSSWHENIQITRIDMTEADYFDHSLRALRYYYGKYAPFERSENVGTEIDVVFALDDEGRYFMRGIIDRLDRRGDGVYEIHDYKCSRTRPSIDKLRADRQLPLYHLAVRSVYPDAAKVELIWHYLVCGRSFRTSKNSQELENIRQSCIKLIDHLESCQDFPAVNSRLCDWCEYKGICDN